MSEKLDPTHIESLTLFAFPHHRGKVDHDPDGSIWWDPQNGKPRELLSDKDSLCGVFPFQTGIDDVFRDCCSRHDYFYQNRAMFEDMGFDRKWMDDQFLDFMLAVAGDNLFLIARAKTYYMFVRAVGWLFYNRHPAGKFKAIRYDAIIEQYKIENVPMIVQSPAPLKLSAPEVFTPRKYGWKRDIPDFNDKMLRVGMAGEPTKPIPSKWSNYQYTSAVFDQGELGSCTAHALASAYIFLQHKRKQDHAFVPSRLFIYYNEREMEGTVDYDSGAAIRDGIKSLNQHGVCPEVHWGYDRDFKQKPHQAAYNEALKNQLLSYQRLDRLYNIKYAIAAEMPVVFGFAVYASFESLEVAKTGIVPFPKQTEEMLGGHAVLAVGYDDMKQHFIVQNSWGADWGDKGFFYLPYTFVTKNLADDFWALDTIE